MSLQLLRTHSTHPDFSRLLPILDAELRDRYGDASQEFYDQFNKVDSIRNVVVAYLEGQPAGCGAFKPYNLTTVEIKRMFVLNDKRSRGIAAAVLNELEQWALALGYTEFVLETGVNQPEAIRLYERAGYAVIPNYGQYAGVKESICMAKVFSPPANPGTRI
jgi:putative acetyltransferase